MNLFARKAFEGLNVEANRGRGNPRQHGSRWAEWSQDGYDAIAFSFRRERYRLSVTGRYRGAGDPANMEPSRSHSWFREVEDAQRGPANAQPGSKVAPLAGGTRIARVLL